MTRTPATNVAGRSRVRPATATKLARLIEALDHDELLEAHRMVSRRAAAIYAERYRPRYEAGMANARGRG